MNPRGGERGRVLQGRGPFRLIFEARVLFLLLQGQGKEEGTALPHFAFDPNFSAVRLNS